MQGKRQGGEEDDFSVLSYDKNKGRTAEAKLAKITKIFASVFFVCALAAVVLFAFVK